MSAVSYELRKGSYGDVRVDKFRSQIRISVKGVNCLALNLLTGVVHLAPNTANIQHKNLYSRFFTLILAKRYSVELHNHKLWLIDELKKSRREIYTSGINVMIPTKCVMKAIQLMNFSLHAWSINVWFEDLERDRQTAPAGGQEQRAEVPF